jgi:hypothetical protein
MPNQRDSSKRHIGGYIDRKLFAEIQRAKLGSQSTTDFLIECLREGLESRRSGIGPASNAIDFGFSPRSERRNRAENGETARSAKDK